MGKPPLGGRPSIRALRVLARKRDFPSYHHRIDCRRATPNRVEDWAARLRESLLIFDLLRQGCRKSADVGFVAKARLHPNSTSHTGAGIGKRKEEVQAIG